MAASKKQLINLLPQEEFASSTFGRIIAWVLSTFRVIVVITEIVVMAAFGSRFILDARLADLNRQIKEQQAIIESFSDFEKEFRGYQEKIQIASSLINSQIKVTDNLDLVSSLTPADTFLSSFSFTESGLSVRGVSPQEISISQLIANLKGQNFSGVDLNQISTTDSGGQYNFLIDIGKQTKE